jgi:hypothetical protein
VDAVAKVVLVLLCVLLAVPSWAATPTLVQSYSVPYDHGGGESGTNPVYTVTLPMASLANNCLIVVINSGGATAYSVSDNINGTTGWTAGPSQTNSGQFVALFYHVGTSAGVRTLTITATNAGIGNPASIHFAEFFNVATSSALDTSGTSANAVSGGNENGPALTTGTAGDLIYTFFGDVTNEEQTTLTKVVAAGGSTPTLIASSLHTGQISMYQVQASAGAITPALTISGTNTDTYAANAIALKSSSAGTAPTITPRILSIQIDELAVSTGSGAYSLLEFPSTGNNFIFAWDGEWAATLTLTLTSITDSASNTWHKDANSDNSSQATTQDFWSAKNATASNTLQPTITLPNGTSAAFHCMMAFIDTTGLDTTGPFDTSHSSNGTQSVSGNLTTDTITPTNTNGIIFNTTMINSHTLSGTSGAGFFPIMSVNASMDGNDNTWWESNGIAQFPNSDASARTFVYTTQHNTAGVGTWNSLSAAYKAPAAAGACSTYRTLTGVGC